MDPPKRRIRSSTNSRERFGEGDNSLSIFHRFRRHVRRNRAFLQSVATKNASHFRSPPGNPAGFQAIGPSHQKRDFFDGLNRADAEWTTARFRPSTNLRERYGEGAHFLSIFNRFWRHVRQNRAFSQSVATENASLSRSPPGNPAGFQAIAPADFFHFSFL